MRVPFVLLLLLAIAPPRATAVPPPDPARFAAEIRAFEAADSIASRGPNRDLLDIAIVFYGSSSIRMWHERMNQDFAPLWVVGRGFGGSTMSEAAFYVDRVLASRHPMAVVLYEGDNDIEMGRTSREVVGDFERLMVRLFDKVPETHLFVLSIKPSAARWTKWPEMKRTNDMLAATCRRNPKRMTFVDIATPMLGPDGRPRRELFLEDQLHLSSRGYETWRDVLRPILLEYFAGLGEKSGSAPGVKR